MYKSDATLGCAIVVGFAGLVLGGFLLVVYLIARAVAMGLGL